MTTPRQQRRMAEKVRLQHGQLAVRAGLATVPSKLMLVGLAALLRECLTNRKQPHPASRSAELMHQTFAASVAQTPGTLKTACQDGCGYCCHNWVAATAPEIFLIARHISARNVDDRLAPAAVMARAKATAGLDIAARFGAKLPCVFLADNRCSIYALRPTVCRQTTSTNLTTCMEEFEGQGLDGEIMVSKTMLDHARNCRLPLLAALSSIGLPPQSYELSAAITRVLATPDAEARWLAGDPVFANIATAPPDPPVLAHAISVIAAEIG
jgi:Fe-S-cluster containining protein